MTTGKIIALIIWTFVGKVMFLLFNTQSRFVIAFLPRGKCLNFMALVTIRSDFRDQEKKVCHRFPNRLGRQFPIYLSWSDGTRCQDLSFLNVEISCCSWSSSMGKIMVTWTRTVVVTMWLERVLNMTDLFLNFLIRNFLFIINNKKILKVNNEER